MKFKFKKALKSFICFVLVLTMVSGLGVFAIEIEDKEALASELSWTPWDLNYNPDERNLMPFTPYEGYITMQNPPDFKWGFVEGADSYEVAVATDRGMTNIKYSQDNIPYNYYNFNHTFETGIHYYWAVRYKKGNTVSEWSIPRKFRIDPDAYEYPFPTSEEIAERIPKGHPRLYATEETLDEIRAYKDIYPQSKEAYDELVVKCDNYIAQGIDSEPDFAKSDDPVVQQELNMQLLHTSQQILDKALYCGFLYMINEDEKYGRFAIDCLMEAATWDINGPTSYANQDQIHREFAYKPAVAYDCLYPLLTEEEKSTILGMVRDRTKVMEYLLDSLQVSPYDSHGRTAYQYICLLSLATYGDLPESKAWFEKSVVGYNSFYPVWSEEDGGWSQGTDYWGFGPACEGPLLPALKTAGVVDMYNKAFSQHQYLFYLYAFNYGSNGAFGDGSGRDAAEKHGYIANISAVDSYYTKNPVARWVAEYFGMGFTNIIYKYLLVEPRESEPPYKCQLANEFYDIGWTVHLNDIESPDRIKLMFKSSPYGSYNHSHADQNSFVIEGFGEQLAVSAGYYDSYHSTHDSGFTRKTYAHNSVTVDNGKGQVDDDFGAKGHLTGYLTQIDFDLTKGNATDAYNGVIGNFERSIVYIRPDVFVVIDDLKAQEGSESRFEWWLNAREPIQVYNEGNGAKITRGNAVLDATVNYPQEVTTYYSDMFAGPDMQEIPAGGSKANQPVDTKVWFETEKTAATKMVVTLDVHRDVDAAKYINTEYFDDYIKMTFEDGTVMFVNLGERTDEVVTKDGYRFTGEAVVFNDDSIMLVGGTNVADSEKDLITLEKIGSVVMGRDELSISTYEDNRISINTNNDYVREFNSVLDFNGRELRKEIGITYESGKLVKEGGEEEAEAAEKEASEENTEEALEAVYTIEPDENYVTFTAEKDNYSLLLNGKTITSETVTTTVNVTLDGETIPVELSGHTGRSGEVTYSGNYDFEGKKLRCISKSDGLIAGALAEGVVTSVGDVRFETTLPEGGSIELESLPVVELTAEATSDYDALKDQLAVFVEGESATIYPEGATPYNDRAFLSGGLGVYGFNTVGTSIDYQVEIKEEGDYDFVIKYVAWNDGGARRSFTINGVDYIFPLEQTTDWGTTPEYWKATRTNSSIHLTPGTYTVSLGVVQNEWNYDWFGFIKK